MTDVRAAIRVPISPTPNYLNRSVLLMHSLHAADPEASRHSIDLFVSPDTSPAPERWRDAVADFGLHWHDVEPASFASFGYAAASLARVRTPTDADVVLKADADMVVIGPVGELIERSHTTQTVLGVTAYRSPFNATTFPYAADHSPRECWSELFARMGLAAPSFVGRHPAGFENGWDTATTSCPAYFNYGVVAMPAPAAAQIGAILADEQARVDKVFSGAHYAQVALTVAMYRLGLRAEELPLRFNFPNQPRYVEPYPQDASDIRILHYMSRDMFDKEADLDDLASIEGWLAAGHDRDPLHARLAEALAAALPVLRTCPWNETS
ncbi:MAG: hypothetical protein AAGA37_15050 [Actinomycetota bacterium]